MNDKVEAYVVLSLKEINRLQRIARRQAKLDGVKGAAASRTCIVLKPVEINNLASDDVRIPNWQISSVSFADAVETVSKAQDVQARVSGRPNL